MGSRAGSAHPRRAHEPQGDHSLYFHQLQPLWLRHGAQWYLRVSLESGDLTWTTARTRRSGLQVFADWIADQPPAPPPWLRDDPAGVRGFMLYFLSHVRAQTARSGPNRGKQLSPLRVNDIVTDVEKFYAFMTDHRETASQTLDEPGWLGLGPYHAILWRHGEKPGVCAPPAGAPGHERADRAARHAGVDRVRGLGARAGGPASRGRVPALGAGVDRRRAGGACGRDDRLHRRGERVPARWRAPST